MIRTQNSKGFTLLEMIIVMGIMGFVLASLAVYKQKQIKAVGRQHLANQIVGEMHGLLQFVNEDEISIDNANGTSIKDKITNPLYDQEYVSSIQRKNNTYSQRVSNTSSDDELAKTGFIHWSDDNNLNGSRRFFTSKSCSTGDNNEVADWYFSKEYLRCRQFDGAADKDLILERVDLVGNDTDTAGRTIDRVDFIVGYYPGYTGEKDTEKFTIGNYITAFEQAFSYLNMSYDSADLIYRKNGDVSTNITDYGSKWELLKIKVAGQDSTVSFSGMPAAINSIEKLNGIAQLGVRFSFKLGATSKYIDASGSTSIEQKLCWNSETESSAYCLKRENGEGRNGEDGIMRLTAKNDVGEEVTGTLMANVIFQGKAFDSQKNMMVDAYMTPPVVSYHAFGNSNASAALITNPENYSEGTDAEPGRIQLPVQSCPGIPGSDETKALKLYPRMVASISSVVADAGKSNGKLADYSNPGENRSAAQGIIDHLSGVALQVNKSDKNKDGVSYWTISATAGIYDNSSGEGTSLVNPSSLSVVLTAWCSSIEQPDDYASGTEPQPLPPQL